jgi:hypothetical protein
MFLPQAPMLSWSQGALMACSGKEAYHSCPRPAADILICKLLGSQVVYSSIVLITTGIPVMYTYTSAFNARQCSPLSVLPPLVGVLVISGYCRPSKVKVETRTPLGRQHCSLLSHKTKAPSTSTISTM